MDRDRVGAIRALLARAEEAHGVYEAAELGGVYDRAWARWYATWAIEHGIGDLLGREVGPDELAALLTAGFAAFEAADPQPEEGWAAYLAERMVAELGA